ncbi:DUF4116 domain-containing protein, partial [Roseibium sp. RKSG952]|uniref:DUF4116 domain-containing protein n=1 Tax=Roseibium sp. RKSG952 TaxID=2529384 RepID=UPI0018AD1454
MCREAVEQDGCALQDVPEALWTPEMCLEAVRQNLALYCIPEALQTPEMCLEAVRQNLPRSGEAKRRAGTCAGRPPDGGDVPRSGEMCLEAVRQNLALEYVPEALRTEEIRLEAVKQDGWALEFVPEDLRTEEACLEAVRQNGRALQFVPEDLRTEEMRLEAAEQPKWAAANNLDVLK